MNPPQNCRDTMSDHSNSSTSQVRGLAHVEGRHSVSDLNFRPEVTSGFDFPKPLSLIDSTIRKVIYTAGVHAELPELLKIGEVLQELGVRDESLNLWWWGEDEPNSFEWEAVRAFGKAGFDFGISVFTDTLVGNGVEPSTKMRRTVDMLAEAGIRTLSPGLIEPPDAEAAKRQADEFLAFGDYARSQGIDWTLTIAHCGRRDFESMIAGINAAIAAGVRRLDPMDSTSTMSPEAMKLYVRTFRSRLDKPVPMTMHTHDDFGMACATTVAAVTAGASPDVSLNGVSYRSGFAALEEVVLALDVLYGVDTGIRLEKLQWAADTLASLMDLPIPPLKPVVGSHQFLRDNASEIVRLNAETDPGFAAMGCSINPGLVGGRMRWVWGSLGNDTAIRAVASNLGLTPNDQQVAAIRAELDKRRNGCTTYPKWVEADEVRQIILSSCGRA